MTDQPFTPEEVDDIVGRNWPRFMASGNTYPYRERFASWGWYWDAERKVWCHEGAESVKDTCVRAMADLPGVTITQEPM